MGQFKGIKIKSDIKSFDDVKNVLLDLSRKLEHRFSYIQADNIVDVDSATITGTVALANGGTNAVLSDPGADKILFWDESGNTVAWLTTGTGLSISGTTISATLASVLLGTTNQITVTDNGDGTYTLSTPQNLDTSADVEFDSIKLDDLTASRLVSSNGSKVLASVSDLSSWISGTTNRITVSNDGDGTITLSTPQDTATASSPTFAGLTLTGFSGVLKTVTGVISGSATIDDIGEGTTYKRLTAVKDGYISQDVTASGTPTFTSVQAAHKSSDGTSGATGTQTIVTGVTQDPVTKDITVTTKTITYKDGLITSII